MGAIFSALFGGAGAGAASATQVPVWQQVVGTMAQMSKKPGIRTLGSAMMGPRQQSYLGVEDVGTGEAGSGITPVIKYKPTTFADRMTGNYDTSAETALSQALLNQQRDKRLHLDYPTSLGQNQINQRIAAIGPQKTAELSTVQGLDPEAQSLYNAQRNAEMSAFKTQLLTDQLKSTQAGKMQEVMQDPNYMAGLKYNTTGRILDEASMFPIEKEGAQISNALANQRFNKTANQPDWVSQPGSTELWSTDFKPEKIEIYKSPQEMQAEADAHMGEVGYKPVSHVTLRKRATNPASTSLANPDAGMYAPTQVVTPSIGSQQTNSLTRAYNDYVIPATSAIQNAWKNYRTQEELDEIARQKQYKGMRNQLINIP